MFEILKKAHVITLKFKLFWFFGFILTGFGFDLLMNPPQLGSASQNVFRDSASFSIMPPLLMKMLQLLTENPRLFLIMLINLSLFFLAYIFLAIVSEGAITFGIANSDDKQKNNFQALLVKGLGFFPRLLLANILIISLTINLLVANFFLIGLMTGLTSANPVLALPALLLYIAAIAGAVFLSTVNDFTKRFIILEDLTVFSSIKLAARLFMGNIKESLKLYFTTISIFIFSAIVYAVILGLLLTPLLLIKSGSVYLTILLIVPIIIFVRFIGAIVTVYMSSVWTLGFLAIKNRENQAAIEEYTVPIID